MKRLFALVMVFMVVLSLCACGSKSEDVPKDTAGQSVTDKAADETTSLVGQWEYDGGVDYLYTFNEDGTGAYSLSGTEMKFTYEDNGDSFSIIYEGNTDPTVFEYTIEGNKLTIIDSFGDPVVYIRK